MKVCTMNCSQGIGDKRTRAQIMAECGDCYDAPDKPKHRVAIAIDFWKQQTFETELTRAGFAFTVENGVSPEVRIMVVETTEIQRLADIVRCTNALCGLKKIRAI